MRRLLYITSMIGLIVGVLWMMAGVNFSSTLAQSNGYSLRFYGYGYNDVGRVKIPIHPHNAADVGGDPTRSSASGDFTIEFWIKATASDNPTGTCIEGNDTWINGNIIIDRDLFGNLSYGDYGISLYGNQIAFGVNNGASSLTLCGGSNVANNTWRHIAVTRQRSNGQMQIFVDGTRLRQAIGPTGNISYDDARSISNLCGNGSQPCNNEPFIVIGAEKHDYNPATYPPYNGFFDELRISNIVRYTSNFTRPSSPFVADANTVALYHFDEGIGNSIADSSGNNITATRFFGGTPNAGPEWSVDTPFGMPSPPTNTPPSYSFINLSSNELLYHLKIQSGADITYLLIGTDTNTLTIYSLWEDMVAMTPITVTLVGYIVQFRQGVSTTPRGEPLSDAHQTMLYHRIVIDLSNAFTSAMNARYNHYDVQDIFISPQGITIGISIFP